jgi:hypothetical protein
MQLQLDVFDNNPDMLALCAEQDLAALDGHDERSAVTSLRDQAAARRRSWASALPPARHH